MLDGFRCPLDLDVENFLRNNAVRFEKSRAAVTYLAITELDGTSAVGAYFTISFTEIELTESSKLSKSARRKVAKPNGTGSETVKAYLLGQLGKDSKFGVGITLQDLMPEITRIVLKAQSIVGARVLILECSSCEKLLEKYAEVGFSNMQMADNGLNQLYKII